MPQAFIKFIPITKVDAAKQEVWGVVTAEMPDKDGEICDYDSTVPYYKAWSEEFAKATDGKSLGNVREMHQPKAVGKLIAIEFDDVMKEIRVGAKIVDPDAWEKCQEGVYTGFSQGGKYVKTKKDGEFVRYTAQPSEVSVVDNPCLGSAHFDYVKGDGTIEVRKFHSATEEEKPVEKAKVVIKGMYSVTVLSQLLDQIKYLRCDSENEAVWEGDARDVEIAKRLNEWLATGIEILKQVVEDETSELLAEDDGAIVMEMAAKVGLLQKAKTLSEKHIGHLKQAHKSMAAHMDKMASCHKDMEECFKAMDAVEEPDQNGKSAGADTLNSGEANEMEKAEFEQELAKATAKFAKAEDVDALKKSVDEQKAANEELKKSNESLTSAVTNLTEAMEKFMAQPAPIKGAAKASISKEEDSAAAKKEEVEKSTDPIELVKRSYANPIITKGHVG
jgi:hypothetical protein